MFYEKRLSKQDKLAVGKTSKWSFIMIKVENVEEVHFFTIFCSFIYNVLVVSVHKTLQSNLLLCPDARPA